MSLEKVLIWPKTGPLPLPLQHFPALFWNCNWAGSGKLPGLHSEVMRVCICECVCARVCVCAGWVGGWVAGRRESSLAGQKSNGCMWTVAPVFARSGLLLIYLFISCLWADWMKWDCRTSEDPALINNSLRDRQSHLVRSNVCTKTQHGSNLGFIWTWKDM